MGGLGGRRVSPPRKHRGRIALPQSPTKRGSGAQPRWGSGGGARQASRSAEPRARAPSLRHPPLPFHPGPKRGLSRARSLTCSAQPERAPTVGSFARPRRRAGVAASRSCSRGARRPLSRGAHWVPTLAVNRGDRHAWAHGPAHSSAIGVGEQVVRSIAVDGCRAALAPPCWHSGARCSPKCATERHVYRTPGATIQGPPAWLHRAGPRVASALRRPGLPWVRLSEPMSCWRGAHAGRCRSAIARG